MSSAEHDISSNVEDITSRNSLHIHPPRGITKYAPIECDEDSTKYSPKERRFLGTTHNRYHLFRKCLN